MECDLLLPQLLPDTEYTGLGCNYSRRQVRSHPRASSFPINEMGIMVQMHRVFFIQMAFKRTAGFSIILHFLCKVHRTNNNSVKQNQRESRDNSTWSWELQNTGKTAGGWKRQLQGSFRKSNRNHPARKTAK